MLADVIGVALLILLDALPPAEHVAFVLHDEVRSSCTIGLLSLDPAIRES